MAARPRRGGATLAGLLVATVGMLLTVSIGSYALTGSGTSFVPYDALYYQALALANVGHPWHLLVTQLTIHSLELNWVGLPTLGSLLASVTGVKYFNVVVTLVNSLLMAWALYDLAYLANKHGARKYTNTLVWLTVVGLPFWMPYLIGLSKEIVSLWLLTRIMVYDERGRFGHLGLILVIAAVIHSQYVAIGLLYLFLNHTLVKPIWVWAAFALLYPILPSSVYGLNPVGATASANTAGLMLAINHVARVPGGYFLALPVRLALDAVGPVWPPAVIATLKTLGANGTDMTTLLYRLSGVTGLIATVASVRAGPETAKSVTSMIWAFCLVEGAIVYVQPRYFLQLVPILMLAALIARARAGQDRDGKGQACHCGTDALQHGGTCGVRAEPASVASRRVALP